MMRTQIIFAVTALFYCSADAQSLREILGEAMIFDPTYSSAKIAASAAVFQAHQTYALRRPSLSLNISTVRVGDSEAVESTREHKNLAELRLTQPIFNSVNDISISQADNEVRRSEAQALIRLQDLIIRVAQAYFNVLSSADVIDYAESNVDGLSEQLAATKTSAAYGVTARADINDAQAHLDLATADLIGARNDLLAKRAILANVIGRPGQVPHRLATPVRLPSLQIKQVEDFLEAYDDIPSILVARIALKNATLEADKSRAARLPTVDLTANASTGTDRLSGQEFETTEGRPMANQLPITTSGSTRQFGIGLTIKVPIFSGFAATNKISQTDLLREAAAADLEGAKQVARGAAIQAFYDFDTNSAQARAFTVAEESAASALVVAKEGYRLGVRANVDVFNAQVQLFNARRQLGQARYASLVNFLKTLQSCGKLRPDDLYQLDGLLER